MSADVLVIGAGLIGASIALHLSRLSVGDILLVDRATAGSAMSCRCSDLVRTHNITFRSEVELGVRSDQMFGASQDLAGATAVPPPDRLRADRPARRGARCWLLTRPSMRAP